MLDISDPSSPEIVGEYLTEGYVYDIKVRDKVVYICDGRGLLILDITDPSIPLELSFVWISGGTSALALDSSFAYVITVSGTMSVVDISYIHNPFLRGITSAGGEWPAFVEAKNGYVYIGNTEWPDLTIIDATNPDTLSNSYFQIDGFGFSSFLKDTLLFIGVNYFSYDLKIYSISNQAEPKLIGQVELSIADRIGEIEVAENDDITYITGTGGIYSIDITDLSQPVILDLYKKNTQRGASVLALTQNTLVASYYSEVCLIDVSDPDSLMLQSFFPTGGFAQKIELKDSLAFVASGLAGLWILDVSNPEKPKTISNVNTDGYTSDLVVEDTLAYLVNYAAYSPSDTSIGLWIIDVSNIYKPVILSHLRRNPNSITKSGNLILLTQSSTPASNYILEIIDVANPYEPFSLGVFQANYNPHNTAVKDSFVYLATSNRGLRIINISDPYFPTEVGFFNDSTFLVGIFVKDNFAYADRTDTLFVLDVSNPTEPVILGRMGRSYGSFEGIDLFVEGGFLYWTEWDLGVVDISNPENPIQVTIFSGKSRGIGVAAKEDKIFFADQNQGVWILRNNLVTEVKEDKPIIPGYWLFQNYPNPFNPVTIIGFEIPKREKVMIEVFDLLGQKVKMILNEEMEKGEHKISFNANDLSSGIYFYRMITGETIVTKKMVLLR